MTIVRNDDCTGILALASVVNYDHNRDATIWGVTYYWFLASFANDSRVIINNHYMFIIQATVKVNDSDKYSSLL